MSALVTDYDIEYDGVIINSGDVTSPYALVNGVVFGDADLRTSDRPVGQLDGEFPGIDLYAGRNITLQVEIWAESATAFRTAYLTWLSAVRKRVSEAVLRLKLPGWPDLRVMARPRKIASPAIDLGFNQQNATIVTVQFHCTDPRFYADSLSSGSASIVASPLGLAFPMAFPLDFGGVSSSNTINASNSGNYETPWTATITGPITNPVIEHVEQAKSLSFAGVLAAGETLVVSSPPSAAVLLQGTSSRYSWLQDASQWFMLQPGNNTVRFRGTGAGTPTMTLNWRSAWVL